MAMLRPCSSARPFATRQAPALTPRASRCVNTAATPVDRRQLLALTPLLLALSASPALAEEATRADLNTVQPMTSLQGKDYGKSRMRYSDYVETASGLQYKDIREGSGDTPTTGQQVVVDWDGYTIGYYGRPFEARNKEYLRFNLGSSAVIPAFEEAILSMKVGGVRRIIVPVELSYLDNSFKKQGPKPSTWAGERALDFVLSNQGMIDKTLLFDIELIRIDK
eukprot:gene18271-24724_t